MPKFLKKLDNHADYKSYVGNKASFPFVAHCLDYNDVHYVSEEESKEILQSKYLTFEALESGTFKFSGATSANTLQYSLDDGQTWTTLAHNTNTPTIATGSNILWKGSGLTIDTNSGIGKYISTGTFNVKGNIMSLHFGDNFSGQTSLSGKDNAYKRLFNGCTNIISAENLSLPSTTLSSNCYRYLFNGCSGLTTAPTTLPATALTDYCYSYMFGGCTSLTTAPSLPATALASWCYYSMFRGCTSLTTAPELPATTLAGDCYAAMFLGCSGLTAAPELPATTLANSCYSSMFQGCANLNYIKAMFTTTPGSNYTNNWVYYVKSTGTFVKNSAAQWDVRGVDGIPDGWTVETASS